MSSSIALKIGRLPSAEVSYRAEGYGARRIIAASISPNPESLRTRVVVPDLGPGCRVPVILARPGCFHRRRTSGGDDTVCVWLGLWLRDGVYDALLLAAYHHLELQTAPARDGSEAAWIVVRYTPVNGGPATVDGAPAACAPDNCLNK